MATRYARKSKASRNLGNGLPKANAMVRVQPGSELKVWPSSAGTFRHEDDPERGLSRRQKRAARRARRTTP